MSSRTLLPNLGVASLRPGGREHSCVSPLDDRGHWARDGDSGARLEYDKYDSFYRCLHCGTKNVVVSETSPFDVPQLKITRVKKGE